MYAQVKFDWVMLANKFTLYYHPKEVRDFLAMLQSDGVGIINSAIFNAGFITGGAYFDYRVVKENDPQDAPLFAWREKFFAVCARFGVAPGDACLKFALSDPAIAAVALNPSKPSRMPHNKAVLEQELPAAFWQALKTEAVIDPSYPYL